MQDSKQSSIDAIRKALDYQEIQNLLGKYCRAIDRVDRELLLEVYHEDGTDDHIDGNSRDFVEFIIPQLQQFSYSMHAVTHATIDIAGDEANSEAYYIAHLYVEGPREKVVEMFGENYAREHEATGKLATLHEYIAGGRYIDRITRRNGVWRISKRVVTNEWNFARPAKRVEQGVFAGASRSGRRDRDDFVYANPLS